ncbi:hypothetical protein BCR43DRAFT_448264, partial [Syncephalastrum racemosum]
RKSQPDGIISLKRNGIFEEEIGYLEVKSPKEAGNHNACNNDLLRLGLFCRQAIEKYRLRACLAIHVVGFFVNFYLMEPQADGLYLFTEIAHHYFPRSVEDLLQFVTSANKLKCVVHVLKTRCIIDVNGRNRVNRATPTFADVEAVTATTKDRKRQNIYGRR